MKQNNKQVRAGMVQAVLEKIVELEKNFTPSLIKSACAKYVSLMNIKNRTERKIRILEAELNKAKAGLK